MSVKVPLNLPPRFIVDVEEGTLRTMKGRRFGVLAELQFSREHAHSEMPYDRCGLGLVRDQVELRIRFGRDGEATISASVVKEEE